MGHRHMSQQKIFNVDSEACIVTKIGSSHLIGMSASSLYGKFTNSSSQVSIDHFLFFPAYKIDKETCELTPIDQFTNVSCTLLKIVCIQFMYKIKINVLGITDS